jgi:hypothetical protein
VQRQANKPSPHELSVPHVAHIRRRAWKNCVSESLTLQCALWDSTEDVNYVQDKIVVAMSRASCPLDRPAQAEVLSFSSPPHSCPSFSSYAFSSSPRFSSLSPAYFPSFSLFFLFSMFVFALCGVLSVSELCESRDYAHRIRRRRPRPCQHPPTNGPARFPCLCARLRRCTRYLVRLG